MKLKRAVNFIETSHSLGKSKKTYYKRKYDLTMYGLILLKRTASYALIADDLRERLMRVIY